MVKVSDRGQWVNGAWKNSVDFRSFQANQIAATEPDVMGQSSTAKAVWYLGVKSVGIASAGLTHNMNEV
jgi:hypothetical protein